VTAGLTRRVVSASGLLALIIGAAFAVLLRATDEERKAARVAIDSQEVLVAANAVERLVIDMETGQRGFILTGQARFLQPWRAARAKLPSTGREFIALASRQRERARSIVAGVDAYARAYSVPLVRAAQRHEPAARSVAVADQGKRRLDALRRQLDTFTGDEARRAQARKRRSHADARRAVVAASAGLGASVALVVLFGAYLTRAMVVPLRRASAMAGRLAGGDLKARMPETGIGEIGTLQRTFNTMAASLETGRDDLARLAEEQAALRRVATLVARGTPPPDVFSAVAEELAQLFGFGIAKVLRYEDDGTATVLGGWSQPGMHIPIGSRLTVEGEGAAVSVRRTERPARARFDGPPGSVADCFRRVGVDSGVGGPIVVQGRLWGVVIGAVAGTEPLPSDVEQRMAEFMELVATAIANAEGRAELTASRARVVATADETRRRIERDLHDGAQQRLVHSIIALKLARRAAADDAKAAPLVEEALEHAEAAIESLRELVHGILPAALSRGLQPAIEGLVARLVVPVTVDVPSGRLPEAVERTAYFVVAEALTNVVKHANAQRAEVRAFTDGDELCVVVADDGVGGARLDDSSGLLGLKDRLSALDGELRVDSPPGGGTTLTARLPLPDAERRDPRYRGASPRLRR
jgi:signal transduction histidine kinase